MSGSNYHCASAGAAHMATFRNAEGLQNVNDVDAACWLAAEAFAAGVPRVCAQLIGLLVLCGLVLDSPVHHCVEYFAGCEALAGGFRLRGYRALPFELDLDPVGGTHDMNTAVGFAHAIVLAVLCVRGGYGHLATVCSSWVWLSRSATMRSSGMPNGFGDNATVVDANVMTSRSVLLLWILDCRGFMATLEQPTSSVMPHYFRMQEWFSRRAVYRYRVLLGYFGADSPKPIYLWSTSACVAGILEKYTRDALPVSAGVYTKVLRNGHMCIDGGAKLKESQAYPVDFGHAMVGNVFVSVV